MLLSMSEDQSVTRLLDKSKEAFTLAVELYNRPTLKYHAESCSIFLCNAWELMLKAYLIKKDGLDAVYYPNEPDRTLSLTDCLKKVFTNDKSPLRINLRELIAFRNTNTHFITSEYEIFYGPFLQAAVTNYAEKLSELHGESADDLIPENYLALSIKRGIIDPEVIRAKYDPGVAKHLFERKDSVVNAAGQDGNTKIAAIFETNLRLVKKASDADLNVFVDPNSDSGLTIVKDIRDSTSYYPYTAKGCLEKVNAQLKKKSISFFYKAIEQKTFNMFHFNLFTSIYHMKGNQRFSFDRRVSNESTSSWTYSQNAVDFIVDRIAGDTQHCIDALVEKRDGGQK